MGVFVQIWFACLVGFVVGALLTWVFWVRPLHRRLTFAANENMIMPTETFPIDAAPTMFPAESPGEEQNLIGPDGFRPLDPLSPPEPLGNDPVVDVPPPVPVSVHEDPVRVNSPVPAQPLDEPVQPTPSTEVRPGPFGPGSVLPLPDGSAPGRDFRVKARTSSMVFHTESSPFFQSLEPQVWFRTAEDARRAGFTSWERPHSD